MGNLWRFFQFYHQNLNLKRYVSTTTKESKIIVEKNSTSFVSEAFLNSEEEVEQFDFNSFGRVEDNTLRIINNVEQQSETTVKVSTSNLSNTQSISSSDKLESIDDSSSNINWQNIQHYIEKKKLDHNNNTDINSNISINIRKNTNELNNSLDKSIEDSVNELKVTNSENNNTISNLETAVDNSNEIINDTINTPFFINIYSNTGKILITIISLGTTYFIYKLVKSNTIENRRITVIDSQSKNDTNTILWHAKNIIHLIKKKIIKLLS